MNWVRYDHEEDGLMQETLAAGQRHMLEDSDAWEATLFALSEQSRQ